MVNITQPQFGLLFSQPSSIELKLREGFLQEQSAARQDNLNMFLMSRADAKATQQAAGQAAAPGLMLDNAKKALELEQMQPKFAAEMGLTQAQTANVLAQASKTQGDDIQSRIGFISNKLGRIKDQGSLTRFNRMMQKMGLMSADQLPQTVDQAQMMYVGSEMNKFQQEHDNKMMEIDKKHKQGLITDAQRSQLELRNAITIDNKKYQVAKSLEDTKYGHQFNLQGLKNQQGPMIINNIRGPIEAKAMGGPVNAGQPYLVGENGPEIVVPQQSGQVIPNHALNQPIINEGPISQDALAAQNIAYGGGAVADQIRMQQQDPYAGQQMSEQEMYNLPTTQTTDPNALRADAMAQMPGFGQAAGGRGGNPDPLASDAVGKVQMLRSAQEAKQGIEGLLYNQDGSLNRINLATARIPGLGVTVPGTDGQLLATKFEQGIQAITRLETGAAMAPSEIENTRTRFQPQALDSEAVAQLKLQLFNSFIDGGLQLFQKDKNGVARFDNTKLDQAFETNARQYVFELIKQANPNKSDADIDAYIKSQGYQFTPDEFNKLTGGGQK